MNLFESSYKQYNTTTINWDITLIFKLPPDVLYEGYSSKILINFARMGIGAENIKLDQFFVLGWYEPLFSERLKGFHDRKSEDLPSDHIIQQQFATEAVLIVLFRGTAVQNNPNRPSGLALTGRSRTQKHDKYGTSTAQARIFTSNHVRQDIGRAQFHNNAAL